MTGSASTAAETRAAGRLELWGELAALAAGLGLVTGVVYAGITLFRQQILGQLVFHSRDIVWLAPLGHMILFTALVPVLAPVGLVADRGRLRRIAAGTYAFLGSLAQLIPWSGLARWAIILFALGVAVQVGRWYGDRDAAQRRRLWRGAVGLAAAVAALGVGQRLWLGVRRTLMAARLGTAPAGAPNVLLIILDTVRGANLSLYGYPRPTTPALERWGREGVIFDRALATAPWTLPSHGTLFTGRLGSELGGDWLTPVRVGQASLAQLFYRPGYATAGFVGNLIYASYESGLAPGFVRYEDYPISWRQVLLHSPLVQTGLARALERSRGPRDAWRALRRFDLQISRRPASEYKPAGGITDAFLVWQRETAGRPFFAFLNYFDAHDPYRAPADLLARFAETGTPQDRYDAAIAYLDRELDRLFAELARRGVLDRTVVVVTSDHGEQFGEHGLRGHANSLYLPVLEVPLILRYPPRVPAGRRVTQAVTLRDLPATILDLAGTGGPAPPVPGTSLAWAWGEPAGAPPSPIVAEVSRSLSRDSRAPNANAWLRSVFGQRFQYIRSGGGAEELFFYTTDSLELRDLAEDPRYARDLHRLRRLFDSATGA
jgi:arylsulfatase A-like enzyme